MNHNHMDQVRKRFVLLAALSVFVLLAVLLSIINGVNFTMAAVDADEITRKLELKQGVFERPESFRNGTPESTSAAPREIMDGVQPEETAPPDGVQPGNGQGIRPGNEPGGNPARRERGPRVGPMGPDSPELAASTRYFTYAFDDNGESERVAFEMTAVSEEDAESWADSLRFRGKTGWTRTTYRYRVYLSDDGREFVSVIDQGRELLPSLRILLISVIGGLFSVIVSYFALLSVSGRLFKPLEEADRKQEIFIADVEKDFKVPLTILDADVEIMEKENGENEQTLSMHRQIKRMASLVKDLSALALFDRNDLEPTELNLSEFARAAADGWREKYQDKGVSLESEIEDHVTIHGDGASVASLLDELLDNALKFGKSNAKISVKTRESRVEIAVSNDTDLPSRGMEEIFDRFTRLENAKNQPGAGLGLSHVREITRAHNGRVSAKTANGVFTLRVRL